MVSFHAVTLIISKACLFISFIFSISFLLCQYFSFLFFMVYIFFLWFSHIFFHFYSCFYFIFIDVQFSKAGFSFAHFFFLFPTFHSYIFHYIPSLTVCVCVCVCVCLCVCVCVYVCSSLMFNVPTHYTQTLHQILGQVSILNILVTFFFFIIYLLLSFTLECVKRHVQLMLCTSFVKRKIVYVFIFIIFFLRALEMCTWSR